MIRGNNIYNTWLKVLEKVYNEGEEVLDERGDKTVELMNVISSFPNPFIKTGNIEYIPEYHNYWQRQKIQDYVKQFNSPEDGGFQYSYGQRIRNSNLHCNNCENSILTETINQVEEVKRKLKENPMTRRATIVTWNPFIDNTQKENPCMVTIDYKIRNNKLQTSAIWRSHCIAIAYYANMIGLAHQSKEIADKVGVELGDFTIQSISAHIRKTDFDEVEKFI